MLFSPFHRARLSRGFLCLGAAGMMFPAHAAEFSPLPTPELEAPFAPALQPDSPAPDSPAPDSPAPDAPDLPLNAPLRISMPRFGPRAVPIVPIVPIVPVLAAPDDFYQTPAQLEGWMLDLAKSRPRQVKTRILGRTFGGRRLIALEVTPPGVSPSKLRRLVVLCRQHGNEPEATAAGARFIREFLVTTDPKKRRITQKTALLIVPIANPDGAAVYRRRTDNKIDMNRDWGRQKTLEVWLLTRWVAASKPNLVVDVHQWLPKERQHEPMAEASGGLLARQTVKRMAKNSAVRGYALSARSRWGLDTLCHRYWGQRFKIPAILLESRHRPGVAGAREVAIGTSLAALWGAAETLAK